MKLLGIIGPQELVLLFFIIPILLLVFILPILALIDILKNNFEQNDKLIWILVTICVPLIGPILYFVIGAKRKMNHK